MQERLVIYMHAKYPDRPSWIVMEAGGAIKANQYQGEPTELAHLATGRLVQVCVPAQDVLLTEAAFQKIARSRLLQMLPYALEDQLIDEVDQLHFAMGGELAGVLPVAVVSHAKMKEWLHQLTIWRIQPNEMLSFIHFLPPPSTVSHMILVEGLLLMRTAIGGIACEPVNFPALFTLMQAEREQMALPGDIIYYADQPILPAEMNAAHQEMPEEQFLITAAQQNKTNPYFINLLQGAYAVKQVGLLQINAIKIGMALLMIWIGLILAYPIVSCFLLKSEINRINLAINQIYHHHFPEATTVIAPKLRLTDKLKQLKAQASAQPLFTDLSDLSQAMEAVPRITLKRLTYQQDQLTLDLSAATSADLSSFMNFLNKQGLNVKQQNANFAGSQINATLLIE